MARAAADAGGAADERQLVVFHEEDDHAVSELNALRLLDLHGVERGRLDVAVVGRLRVGAHRQQRAGDGDGGDGNRSHFAPPLAAAGAGGGAVSTMPTARRVATNGALDTR